MGRFVQVNVVTQNLSKVAPKVPLAKTYYDGKECWQYKVVYDRPGTYTFTVPANAICARTVIVGGGGKPVCTNGNCCGFAGAGGGYSDKCHAVTPGSTAFTIVVGRQSQDSSVACNSVAVHTAGGAAACTEGTATGGNWNSVGGCAGFNCNFCNGSLTHYCGACIYLNCTTCCGYCVVFGYTDTDHGDTRNGCCVAAYAGGGSAGSPRHCKGGCGMTICNSGTIGHGGTAGGGGGVGGGHPGSSPAPVWQFTCCNCVCPGFDGNVGGGCQYWQICNPTGAGGGGGSHTPQPMQCRSWEGTCQMVTWQGGCGGLGGNNTQAAEAMPAKYNLYQRCRYNDSYGVSCPHWKIDFNPKRFDPCYYPWWDICNISGAGAPGHVNETNYFWCCMPTQLSGFWGRPANSGEGAGTGGTMFRCCNIDQAGDAYPVNDGSPANSVNWILLCCLGALADPFRCDSAYNLKDKLFSGFISCAGTLGGSGGTGMCNYTSKAGFGGGGGHAKCHFVCVCWGGSFNCCNGAANTPLAFPPCILDNLLSNAGSGMAIVYYKEA